MAGLNGKKRNIKAVARAFIAMKNGARKLSDDRVEFSYCKEDYLLDASEEKIYRVDAYGNTEELPTTDAKCQTYKGVTLGGKSFLLHQLAQVLLNDDYLDTYLNNTNAEINHMICEPYHVGGGCLDTYRTASRPIKGFIVSPKFTEVVSKSENIAHGNFMKEFNIYGVVVRAKDVMELRSLIYSRWDKGDEVAATDIVLDYYKSKEPSVQHDFRACLSC
jgi:hypothetical protein